MSHQQQQQQLQQLQRESTDPTLFTQVPLHQNLQPIPTPQERFLVKSINEYNATEGSPFEAAPTCISNQSALAMAHHSFSHVLSLPRSSLFESPTTPATAKSPTHGAQGNPSLLQSPMTYLEAPLQLAVGLLSKYIHLSALSKNNIPLSSSSSDPKPSSQQQQQQQQLPSTRLFTIIEGRKMYPEHQNDVVECPNRPLSTFHLTKTPDWYPVLIKAQDIPLKPIPNPTQQQSNGGKNVYGDIDQLTTLHWGGLYIPRSIALFRAMIAVLSPKTMTTLGYNNISYLYNTYSALSLNSITTNLISKSIRDIHILHNLESSSDFFLKFQEQYFLSHIISQENQENMGLDDFNTSGFDPSSNVAVISMNKVENGGGMNPQQIQQIKSNFIKRYRSMSRYWDSSPETLHWTRPRRNWAHTVNNPTPTNPHALCCAMANTKGKPQSPQSDVCLCQLRTSLCCVEQHPLWLLSSAHVYHVPYLASREQMLQIDPSNNARSTIYTSHQQRAFLKQQMSGMDSTTRSIQSESENQDAQKDKNETHGFGDVLPKDSLSPLPSVPFIYPTLDTDKPIRDITNSTSSNDGNDDDDEKIQRVHNPYLQDQATSNSTKNNDRIESSNVVVGFTLQLWYHDKHPEYTHDHNKNSVNQSTQQSRLHNNNNNTNTNTKGHTVHSAYRGGNNSLSVPKNLSHHTCTCELLSEIDCSISTIDLDPAVFPSNNQNGTNSNIFNNNGQSDVTLTGSIKPHHKFSMWLDLINEQLANLNDPKQDGVAAILQNGPFSDYLNANTKDNGFGFNSHAGDANDFLDSDDDNNQPPFATPSPALAKLQHLRSMLLALLQSPTPLPPAIMSNTQNDLNNNDNNTNNHLPSTSTPPSPLHSTNSGSHRPALTETMHLLVQFIDLLYLEYQSHFESSEGYCTLMVIPMTLSSRSQKESFLVQNAQTAKNPRFSPFPSLYGDLVESTTSSLQDTHGSNDDDGIMGYKQPIWGVQHTILSHIAVPFTHSVVANSAYYSTFSSKAFEPHLHTTVLASSTVQLYYTIALTQYRSPYAKLTGGTGIFQSTQQSITGNIPHSPSSHHHTTSPRQSFNDLNYQNDVNLSTPHQSGQSGPYNVRINQPVASQQKSLGHSSMTQSISRNSHPSYNTNVHNNNDNNNNDINGKQLQMQYYPINHLATDSFFYQQQHGPRVGDGIVADRNSVNDAGITGFTFQLDMVRDSGDYDGNFALKQQQQQQQTTPNQQNNSKTDTTLNNLNGPSSFGTLVSIDSRGSFGRSQPSGGTLGSTNQPFNGQNLIEMDPGTLFQSDLSQAIYARGAEQSKISTAALPSLLSSDILTNGLSLLKEVQSSGLHAPTIVPTNGSWGNKTDRRFYILPIPINNPTHTCASSIAPTISSFYGLNASMATDPFGGQGHNHYHNNDRLGENGDDGLLSQFKLTQEKRHKKTCFLCTNSLKIQGFVFIEPRYTPYVALYLGIYTKHFLPPQFNPCLEMVTKNGSPKTTQTSATPQHLSLFELSSFKLSFPLDLVKARPSLTSSGSEIDVLRYYNKNFQQQILQTTQNNNNNNNNNNTNNNNSTNNPFYNHHNNHHHHHHHHGTHRNYTQEYQDYMMSYVTNTDATGIFYISKGSKQSKIPIKATWSTKETLIHGNPLIQPWFLPPNSLKDVGLNYFYMYAYNNNGYSFDPDAVTQSSLPLLYEASGLVDNLSNLLGDGNNTIDVDDFLDSDDSIGLGQSKQQVNGGNGESSTLVKTTSMTKLPTDTSSPFDSDTDNGVQSDNDDSDHFDEVDDGEPDDVLLGKLLPGSHPHNVFSGTGSSDEDDRTYILEQIQLTLFEKQRNEMALNNNTNVNNNNNNNNNTANNKPTELFASHNTDHQNSQANSIAKQPSIVTPTGQSLKVGPQEVLQNSTDIDTLYASVASKQTDNGESPFSIPRKPSFSGSSTSTSIAKLSGTRRQSSSPLNNNTKSDNIDDLCDDILDNTTANTPTTTPTVKKASPKGNELDDLFDDLNKSNLDMPKPQPQQDDEKQSIPERPSSSSSSQEPSFNKLPSLNRTGSGRTKVVSGDDINRNGNNTGTSSLNYNYNNNNDKLSRPLLFCSLPIDLKPEPQQPQQQQQPLIIDIPSPTYYGGNSMNTPTLYYSDMYYAHMAAFSLPTLPCISTSHSSNPLSSNNKSAVFLSSQLGTNSPTSTTASSTTTTTTTTTPQLTPRNGNGEELVLHLVAPIIDQSVIQQQEKEQEHENIQFGAYPLLSISLLSSSLDSLVTAPSNQ